MSNFHGVNYKINSKGPMNDLLQSRYLHQVIMDYSFP